MFWSGVVDEKVIINNIVTVRCNCLNVQYNYVNIFIRYLIIFIVLNFSFHLRATGRHLLYGITQCYLPQVNAPRLTSAMQADTQRRFTYPGGMEG